jgi:hypothetical protein
VSLNYRGQAICPELADDLCPLFGGALRDGQKIGTEQLVCEIAEKIVIMDEVEI